MKKVWARLTQWEYWPFSVLYFPVYFYYIWLAIKRGSLFFFTASNPKIDFGGMFGEKKSEIYDIIPEEFIPKTVLVSSGDGTSAFQQASEMGYPLIAKPNIGERGIWVKRIENEDQLEKYVCDCPVDFLLQELVDFTIELGVFYVRFPNEVQGRVTSIVRKNFLKVLGDGRHTINQLLKKNERALLTADLESEFLSKNGEEVPEMGEEVLIEPIGNHCRGTQFLSDNQQISEKLNAAFDRLARQIPDFYFGRFDLRCASYEDLIQLKNFKILELNGAGAEPGHIYQPGYSLLQAYKDILWHLATLSKISAENKQRGIPYWTFKKGYQKWKAHKRYNRLLSA